MIPLLLLYHHAARVSNIPFRVAISNTSPYPGVCSVKRNVSWKVCCAHAPRACSPPTEAPGGPPKATTCGNCVVNMRPETGWQNVLNKPLIRFSTTAKRACPTGFWPAVKKVARRETSFVLRATRLPTRVALNSNKFQPASWASATAGSCLLGKRSAALHPAGDICGHLRFQA